MNWMLSNNIVEVDCQVCLDSWRAFKDMLNMQRKKNIEVGEEVFLNVLQVSLADFLLEISLIIAHESDFLQIFINLKSFN